MSSFFIIIIIHSSIFHQKHEHPQQIDKIENDSSAIDTLNSIDPNHPSSWLKKCQNCIDSNDFNSAFEVLNDALSKIDSDKRNNRAVIWKAMINLHLTHSDDIKIKSALLKASQELGSAIAYKHAIQAAANLSKFDLALQFCTKLSKSTSLATKEGLSILKSIIDFCIANFGISSEFLKQLIESKYNSGGKFLLEFKTYAAVAMFGVDANLGEELFEKLCFENPKKHEIYIAYIVALSQKKDKLHQAGNLLKRFLAINPKDRTLNVLKSKLNCPSCKSLFKIINTKLSAQK